jgi:hypothetical protein
MGENIVTTPAEQASERNAQDDIALSKLWPFARAAVPYWIARAERAEAACQLLARLAADTPQFDNPLHVYEAKRIRDAILEGRTP